MTEGIVIRFRLEGAEAEALRTLSAAEMRNPRNQTRFILRRELVQRGLLTGGEHEGVFLDPVLTDLSDYVFRRHRRRRLDRFVACNDLDQATLAKRLQR